MTLKEYQQLTRRTNADLGSPQINAAHCALGIVGEGTEFDNAILEYYDTQGNREEIFKEGGDICWYVSELANIFSIKLTLVEHYNCMKSIGWVAENVKKYLAYQKQIDIVELQKHLESILYYVAETIDETGYVFEECLETNIEKLRKRFPEKFTAADAIAQKDMK